MFLGLDEHKAKCLANLFGYSTRVLLRDNVSFVKLHNHNTDRVNFHIENGVITKAWLG